MPLAAASAAHVPAALRVAFVELDELEDDWAPEDRAIANCTDPTRDTSSTIDAEPSLAWR
jgi:hypothetical protein